MFVSLRSCGQVGEHYYVFFVYAISDAVFRTLTQGTRLVTGFRLPIQRSVLRRDAGSIDEEVYEHTIARYTTKFGTQE